MSLTADWVDKFLDYQQPSREWPLNSAVGSLEFSGSSAVDSPVVTVVAGVVDSFGVESPCLMMVNPLAEGT